MIPMERKRNKNSARVVSRKSLQLIFGLLACFTAASVLSACLAQPAVRLPGARAAEVAPRQRTVQIDTVSVGYLLNSARTRLSDTGYSTPRRGSWMRILIQFTTQPDWTDEVRFNCYVLLRDTNRRTMLTGSVTCVNVERGRQRLVSIFVRPNAIERYGGRVEAVAVECYHQNVVVADYLIPRSTRKWWEEYTGVPGTMVTWFYTPFLRDGVERYEQIKIEREGF